MVDIEKVMAGHIVPEFPNLAKNSNFNERKEGIEGTKGGGN